MTTLEHIFRVENLPGPFLVVVPLSTIEHWQREFYQWTEMVSCMYHDPGGGRESRATIRDYEWYIPFSVSLFLTGNNGLMGLTSSLLFSLDGFYRYFKGRSKRMLKFNVLVTTYDVLMKDWEELSPIAWRVVVVDEAHRLRTAGNRLTECLDQILQRGEAEYVPSLRLLRLLAPPRLSPSLFVCARV